MIARRELLAGSIIAGALFGGRADGCSLVADPRKPFSDQACKRELSKFVELLNAGPQLPMEAIVERADSLSVNIEGDLTSDVLGVERDASATDRDYLFFKEFRVSGGRVDPRPIKLFDVNLIRRVRNRATYQFTLERYSYHPADPEGCNGLFTHDEYYGTERKSYLATFWNNRFSYIKPFPEWYLEEQA